MHFCYIDESGDSQAISKATDEIQPMLTIIGLFVDAAKIKDITQNFISLKRQYYPNLFASVRHDLDVLLNEIKGSDLRTDIRKAKAISEKKVQHHFRFLDDLIALCNSHQIKIVGRVWVKDFGIAIQDSSVYTITSQNIAARFQKYLGGQQSRGAIIADFRDPKRNQYVSHSIFTQKHRKAKGGDAYPLIEETATFGMSNNHACLQMADIICSAILAPIAGRSVLASVVTNSHTHPNYEWVRARYSRRIKSLQYHCKYGRVRYWGITVRDNHNDSHSIF